MKIETQENQIILKEVYNSITLETKEGKKLYICMRDLGYEMKIDDGDWHLITTEKDFKPKENIKLKMDDKKRETFINEFEVKYGGNWLSGTPDLVKLLDEYEMTLENVQLSKLKQKILDMRLKLGLNGLDGLNEYKIALNHVINMIDAKLKRHE